MFGVKVFSPRLLMQNHMTKNSVDWKRGSSGPSCDPHASPVEDRGLEISVDDCASTFLHRRS